MYVRPKVRKRRDDSRYEIRDGVLQRVKPFGGDLPWPMQSARPKRKTTIMIAHYLCSPCFHLSVNVSIIHILAFKNRSTTQFPFCITDKPCVCVSGRPAEWLVYHGEERFAAEYQNCYESGSIAHAGRAAFIEREKWEEDVWRPVKGACSLACQTLVGHRVKWNWTVVPVIWKRQRWVHGAWGGAGGEWVAFMKTGWWKQT